jgi:hypothetical protein
MPTGGYKVPTLRRFFHIVAFKAAQKTSDAEKLKYSPATTYNQSTMQE